MASFVVLWSIVLLANFDLSYGLICYECTSNDPASQCVVNNGRPVECSAKYCMLYRIESNDGNTAFSLIRACTNIPTPPGTARNGENHELKYYFRYCSEDWCNGGDGTSSDNPPSIIVVEGITGSAVSYSLVNFFLLVMSSLYQIMMTIYR